MAVYFPESNILYIHFPKTGGCSFYEVIQKIPHVTYGFQHDTVDMLGKHFWLNKPKKVVVFSREENSWFKSYHRWRSRNTEEFNLPGTNENWHPKWVLEELFDRDYKVFMSAIEEFYPNYYNNLCERYYNHPTFNMEILPYEDFENSYSKLYKWLGYEHISFEHYPKKNATRVLS